MDGILSAEIIQSGFAVAVCAFLLVRLDKEIKALTNAIENLRRCQVCKIPDLAEPDDIPHKTL